MTEKAGVVFLRLLEKSPGIALTVLCIMLVRAMLRSYPKKYSYILWAGLGLRLLWMKPIRLEAVQPFSSRVFHTGGIWNRIGGIFLNKPSATEPGALAAHVQSAGGTAHGALAPGILAGESQALAKTAETVGKSADVGQRLVSAATVIWMLGMIFFLGYFIVSYLKMRRRVRFAVRLRENIYECEAVDSPFAMGFWKPRIYLPLHMEEERQKPVICHESCHIRRKDYLVKLLAFFLLGIYWFHPLVWAGYILMCRDMEMSCDELAVEKLGICSKQSYSAALLALAAERSFMGNMLGFGEHSAGKRIKNILNFRIPGKAGKAAVGVLCGLLIPVLGCEMALGQAEEGGAGSTKAATENVKAADAPMLSEEGDGAKAGSSTEAGSSGNWNMELELDRAQIAQELYDAATPYIGDAPAVGRLLGVMQKNGIMPEDEGTMELLTDEPPYGLIIHFAKEPTDEEELCRKMYDTGLLLWALVENLENVEWSYPSAKEGEQVGLNYYLGKEELKGAFGSVKDIENIKEYGKSAEKVEELMKAAGIGRERTPQLQVPKDGESLTFDSVSVEELRQPDEATIIGGADGPTSVFLAGKIEKTDLDEAIDGYLMQQNANKADEMGWLPIVSHVRLESEISPDPENGVYTVYLWTMCKRYDCKFGQGAEMEEKSVVSQPAVMKLWLDENREYQLKSFWKPDSAADLETLEALLRENFPSDLWEKVLDGEPCREELEAQCDEEAERYLKALDSVSYTTDEANEQ